MSSRATRATAYWSALFAACASCSLVDLSSRINQASCKFDAECEILNTTENPDFSVCRPFICGAQHFCEPARRDSDHDGFTTKDCTTDRAEADCNDLDPLIHPHATESCDELDNDCDDLYDEGVLASERSTALDFGNAKPTSDLAYAYEPGRHELALSYALGTAPRVVAMNRVDLGPVRQQATIPVAFGPPPTSPLHADSAAVGYLPALATLVAAYSNDEPQRFLVGAVESAATALPSGPSVAGLRCAPDEACAANSSMPQQAIAVPFSEAPILALCPDGMLVAYLRNPERDPGLCRTDQPLAKRVLANLVVSAGQNDVGERTRAAAEIGLSADSAAPGLLGIPSLTTNGLPYGWLVAYPNAKGELSLAHVSFAGGALEVSEPLLTLSAGADPLHAPRLAWGHASAERNTVGLSAERGCGAASRIVFGQLEMMFGDHAGITLRSLTKLRELGGGDSQHGTSLAYSEQRRSWALAYRDASGLRARLVTDSGAPTGEAPYLLDDDPSSSEPASATALVALQSGLGWFAVFAYANANASAPARLVRTTLSSCATPSLRPLQPNQRVTADAQ